MSSPSGSQSARQIREAIDQQSALFNQHLQAQQQLMEAMQAQLTALQGTVEVVDQRTTVVSDRVAVAATDARSALDTVQQWSEHLASAEASAMEAEPTLPPPPQQSEPQPSVPQPPADPLPAQQQQQENLPVGFGDLPRSLRLERPPVFDGAMDGDTVSNFVHKLDVLFTLTGLLDNNKRAAYTVTCLEKSAYTWYISQNYRLKDLGWPQLKQDLLDHFRPIDYTYSTRQELSKCKQTGDVRGYVRAFRLKYTRCTDVSDDEAKFRFIEGLYPEEQRHVRLAQPADFHQAAAVAEQIAVTMPQRNTPQHQPRSGQHHSGHRRGPVPMQMGNMDGQQGGRGGSGGGRVGGQQGQQQRRFWGECHYCKRKGHKAADCRKKARDEGRLSGMEGQQGSGASGSGSGDNGVGTQSGN